LNTVVNDCRERVDLLETCCIWTLSWTTWSSSDYCIWRLSSVAWSTGDTLYVITVVNNLIYWKHNALNVVVNDLFWRHNLWWSPLSTTLLISVHEPVFIQYRQS